MSRINQRKLIVDPNAATTSWVWYVTTKQNAADQLTWLAEIDAGTLSAIAVTDVPEWVIDGALNEGDYDFAVVQADAAGNTSDPATFPAWAAVPLDIVPPPPATGGAIVSAG